MDNLQPGQMLGPYRIIDQIGQGGMATVYKAYHAAMDRYVALKVLPRQLADSPEFIGRFQQEARIIAKLEHAHILPVHDYGESEGATYLVMRYLDAGTLKDRLASGPLALAEVDRLFSQLADALDYAHAHGVIHRDLKPSNVLVDERGNLFLTDFGIAKLLESTAHFTTTGGLIGTPAYMSPEQAEGQKADRRTDVYSLGIILYEMVTGRVPFEAETPLAVVLKHLKEPLPLPSQVKPGVASGIERVLLKALAKNPDDRFASVGDFLKAWKGAYAEATASAATVAGARPPAPEPGALPEAASPAPTAEAAPKRGGPSLGLLLGLGALVVVLVGGGLFAARFVRARREARVNPTPTTTGVSAETTVAPLLLPTAAPASSPQWASWAAGNNVEVVLVHDDEVLSAGWGGLTVWNRANGEIVARYTTADGVPNPYVMALLADPNSGQLWIGTDGGLVTFDGKDWVYYTSDDGLDSDTISALGWWNDTLVAGTTYSDKRGGGLNLFDGKQWSDLPDFPSANPDAKPDRLANSVNAILTDSSGGLWVATQNGLGRYDGQSWTRFSTDDGLPANNVRTLYLDSAGTLWVGTEEGAASFNGVSFQPTAQGPAYGVYGIVQDARGRYWFSGGSGVWRFDPANGDWQEFSNQTGDLPSYSMFQVASDADGNLYFGSDGSGVVQYDGQQFDVWRVPNVPGLASFGQIVAPPDRNELWFVQEYGGRVDTLALASETWSALPEQECDCWPLLFGPDGTMYGAQWTEFWMVGDGKATRVGVDEGLPPDSSVTAAALTDGGMIWIGTDHGLAQFDGAKVAQVLTAENTGFASDSIRALLAASDGSLWVGTDGGLSHLSSDGQWEHFTHGNPFSDNFSLVSDLAEDAGGVLWVTTFGDGAYRYAGGQWERFLPTQPNVLLPSDSLNSVTVAPDGSVWFGAYYAGAARFNGSEWYSFAVPDLIDWNINDIYVEDDGTLWFATSGGVTRYVP